MQNILLMGAVGRNESCPCGSGKKYKRCCLESSQPIAMPQAWYELREMEGNLYRKIFGEAEEIFDSEEDFLDEAWIDFAIPEELLPSDEDSVERFCAQVFEKWALFQWQCLSRDLDDGTTEDYSIAESFWLDHGEELTALEHRYIDKAIHGFLSFFEILEVRPGHSFQIRDLFTGKDFNILEQSGSQNAQPGNLLFGLPLELEGFSVLLATGIMQIPPSGKGPLLKMRNRLKEESPDGQITLAVMKQFEVQDLLMTAYLNFQKDLFEPRLPVLQNTDGELMRLVKLQYEISITPEETIERLKDLAVGWTDKDFDAHTTRDKHGRFVEVEVLWLKIGNAKMAWDSTILGRFIIKKNTMTVEINSEERSSRIQAEIETRLGKDAKLKSSKAEAPEKLLVSHKRRKLTAKEIEEDSKNKKLNESPEVQTMIREYMEKHWKAWVDMALPALDGKTPKEAVCAPEGRELVEALIREAEQRDATRPPLTRIDLNEVRRSLGLELQPQ